MNDQSNSLSRDSDLPLYKQVVEALNGRIDSGGLKLGEMLPSESALMDEFGVSRITVRDAACKTGQFTFAQTDHINQRHCRTVPLCQNDGLPDR